MDAGEGRGTGRVVRQPQHAAMAQLLLDMVPFPSNTHRRACARNRASNAPCERVRVSQWPWPQWPGAHSRAKFRVCCAQVDECVLDVALSVTEE